MSDRGTAPRPLIPAPGGRTFFRFSGIRGQKGGGSQRASHAPDSPGVRYAFGASEGTGAMPSTDQGDQVTGRSRPDQAALLPTGVEGKTKVRHSRAPPPKGTVPGGLAEQRRKEIDERIVDPAAKHTLQRGPQGGGHAHGRWMEPRRKCIEKRSMAGGKEFGAGRPIDRTGVAGWIYMGAGDVLCSNMQPCVSSYPNVKHGDLRKR